MEKQFSIPSHRPWTKCQRITQAVVHVELYMLSHAGIQKQMHVKWEREREIRKRARATASTKALPLVVSTYTTADSIGMLQNHAEQGTKWKPALRLVAVSFGAGVDTVATNVVIIYAHVCAPRASACFVCMHVCVCVCVCALVCAHASVCMCAHEHSED